jgi:hypothetical protein
MDLYRHLLQKEVEIDIHLGVLAGRPDERWPEKAKLAVESGYTPEEIARVSFRDFEGGLGSESQHWSRWAEAFRDLESEHPRVEKALDHGKRIAEEKAEQASTRERQQRI